MTTPYSFEDLMLQGLVYHYSKRLAEAWQAKDDKAVEEIKVYIKGNYGSEALQSIVELAIELLFKM